MLYEECLTQKILTHAWSQLQQGRVGAWENFIYDRRAMILLADSRTIQRGKKVGAAHLEMLLILQSRGAVCASSPSSTPRHRALRCPLPRACKAPEESLTVLTEQNTEAASSEATRGKLYVQGQVGQEIRPGTRQQRGAGPKANHPSITEFYYRASQLPRTFLPAVSAAWDAGTRPAVPAPAAAEPVPALAPTDPGENAKLQEWASSML